MEHNITCNGEVIFLTDTNVSIMISMLNEENIFSISIAAVNIIGIGPYLHKNGTKEVCHLELLLHLMFLSCSHYCDISNNIINRFVKFRYVYNCIVHYLLYQGISSSDVTSQIHTGIITTDTLSCT